MQVLSSTVSNPERVVFLDRDGVINENRDDYVKSWQEFHFLPGSLEALRLLTEWDFTVFIVTNQAAINRGLVTCETVEGIHRALAIMADGYGAKIRDVRYCPHRPDESCQCRKPRPGMLLSLAHEHHFDPRRAFMVGDAFTDIAAGKAIGCQTVLVRTGRGADQLTQPHASTHRPEYIARNLLDAAHWIMLQRHKGSLQRRLPQAFTPLSLPPLFY